ncbi:MAG TPA: NAD(P)/FAD-dependent oxidoreductase [Candidatus Bathyarchaeia archaeon]|jgi:phytoene dehydrogenase-like protein|nr:NAD(P)/FAD-dependent oxidoreductase [Candidatus Bathyarchaeia archaeon]
MAKTTRPAPRSGNRRAAPTDGHVGENGTDPITNLPDRRAGNRTYDAIVIGGGHNGLVNGAYLAKSGLRTLILERRHLVGGAAITEELRPGYWFTTFSYALSLLRPDIIHDLELTKHGFMPLLMPSTFAPMENGDYLLLGQDHGENLREIARHSRHDADAYEKYNHDVLRVCRAIKPLLDQVPPDIFSDDPEELIALAAMGSRFRRLDKKVLHDAVRLLTGSAADFLDDYFDSEIVKGYLASSSIIGTKVGPYSQGSGLVLLYHTLGEHDGEFGAWAFHKQGNGGFTKVLARAAQAFGAEIALESPVERVITRGGEAIGVALADGTEFHAPVVVSALDPRRTFLELVDPRELPTDLVETIERFRFQGTSAKVNFALDGAPRYPALGDRSDQYRGFTNIGPSMEYLERAYDDAKYGWYSKRPYIDGAIQSTIDPDMAPPGKHVMSTFIQYAPYHLKGSDWDTEKERFGDTVQATLESFFPGFGDLVLQREIRTPLDIERTVGLSEGNIFAGEFLAPQMWLFRPAPGWSQYRTPIAGYYQCGSGTHPGGCVMGAPGKLAAGQILKDRGATTRRGSQRVAVEA